MRAPPASEWERIKPILKHLYIDLDLPLHEVAATLEREHHFQAE